MRSKSPFHNSALHSAHAEGRTIEKTTRVDVVLEIGQMVDSIEVKADAPLLETETSTVGHFVSGDIRNRLPTPQQKIQSILWYMPGVTSQRGDGHIAGQRSRAFVAAIKITFRYKVLDNR